MSPGVSQEAIRSGTFATTGRANHELLPDKEQEDEDADDQNMTSAELSKVLVPDGAVIDILKSKEVSTFVQNKFHDVAMIMLSESMRAAIEETDAELNEDEFDAVLMSTLNAANLAMISANASSNQQIESKLQESLNNKLGEQATARSVNEWTASEGAVASKLDEDYDKVYETVFGNNTKLVELIESKTVLDDKQNEEVETRNIQRFEATIDGQVNDFHEVDYQEYSNMEGCN